MTDAPPPKLLERLLTDLDTHVRSSQGYETESMINPLRPVDPVSAFATARRLVDDDAFDLCVSVAPEGHVYGYFFQRCFGAELVSVWVGYPPRACEALDDLSAITERRVLILEDDVASGTTLRLVIETLQEYRPATLDLYLGRPKSMQVLDNVPEEIGTVYLAEEVLSSDERADLVAEFVSFFDQNAPLNGDAPPA